MGLVADNPCFDNELTFEDATGDDIYGYEDNLHTSSNGMTCKNNPGHHGFIPVKEFTKDHLPREVQRDGSYFQFLQCAIDTVVHIDVTKVSSERPDGFPHYNRRGKKQPRVGSGWVLSARLCGLPDPQVGKVELAMLEECLKEYTLSEIPELLNERSTLELLTDEEILQSSRVWDGDLQQASDYLHRCVSLWAECHLLRDDTAFSTDEFSRTLVSNIHDVMLCKYTDQPFPDWEKETFTLNDYRERIADLDVVEFCTSLARGLGKGKEESSIRKFWEEHAPFLGKPCQCQKCIESGNPETTWWLLEVATAAHVIFDLQEAQAARVSLFFDDIESKPVSTFAVPYLNRDSSRDKEHRKSADCFTFFCALHDHSLGERLSSNIKKIESLQLKPTKTSPVAVISHPHGCTKHISLGENSGEYDFFRCVYDAPTCPGSSGGLVIRFARVPLARPHSRREKEGGRGRSSASAFYGLEIYDKLHDVHLNKIYPLGKRKNPKDEGLIRGETKLAN